MRILIRDKGERTGNRRGGQKKEGSIHVKVRKDACIFPHTKNRRKQRRRIRNEALLVICSGLAPLPASSKPPAIGRRGRCS